MKAFFAFLVIVMIAGCAETTTLLNQAVTGVNDATISTAQSLYAHKDCIGGLVQAKTESSQRATNQEALIIAEADKTTKEYLECLYLGRIGNYSSAGIESIIATVSALVKSREAKKQGE